MKHRFYGVDLLPAGNYGAKSMQGGIVLMNSGLLISVLDLGLALKKDGCIALRRCRSARKAGSHDAFARQNKTHC